MTPSSPTYGDDGTRTVVVVPTYDEAEGILDLVDAVRRHAPGVDVLVVDDASPDGTADLVRGHADFATALHLLARPGRSGLGSAYRAGFDWALARGYDVVVQMDADLSHPPQRLPALLGALGSADVAVGSRYVPGGGVVDWPWRRRLLSRAGNAYVRLVLGVPTHDATSGYRAFRRDAVERIGLTASEADGYCFQVESTWRAHRRGLRVVELPITFRDRTRGTSKMSGAIVREALLRALAWRWAELTDRGRRPAATAGRASRRAAV